MITALIIEDEAPARKQLLRLLSAHSDFISVKGEAKTGHEAIALIASLKPDLLFLDIHLPDMNAFDVLTSLEGPSPYIIFTTAYDQYALKAFEVFSVEYLLKPLEESRFHAAIEKLKQLISRHQAFHMDVDHLKTMYAQQLHDKKIQALAVKQGQAITLIDFSKIAYMKAEDKYVFVYHPQWQKVPVRQSPSCPGRTITLPTSFVFTDRSSSTPNKSNKSPKTCAAGLSYI
ncbi:MAG: response regulator [Saprospiraceae bacterium]|nr:response regulator [Saprospiraceae bacterium]